MRKRKSPKGIPTSRSRGSVTRTSGRVGITDQLDGGHASRHGTVFSFAGIRTKVPAELIAPDDDEA